MISYSYEYLSKQMLQEVVSKLCAEKSAEFISLSDVASVLHLTPKYLSVVFKKKIGISFKDYMQNMRLEKIALKLLTTDDNIIDIAQSCGYSNIKQFYKVFYNKYSTTPARFRKAMKHSGSNSFKTNVFGWVGIPDTWRITDRGYETINFGHHALSVCGVCLDGTKPFSFKITGNFKGNSLGILFGVRDYTRASILGKTSALILDAVYKAGFMMVESNVYASRLLPSDKISSSAVNTLILEYDCQADLLTGYINGEIISKVTVTHENMVGNLGIIASLSDAVIYSAEFSSDSTTFSVNYI